MKTAKLVELEPPRRGEQIWTAIEDQAAIRRAMNQWERGLREGAKLFAGLGSEIIWIPSESYWCHFHKPQREHPNWTYWNVFGIVPEKFDQNMIVQIDPPISGKNTNVQGVVAKDESGRTWVMHGGRLHPLRRRVKGEEFDARYNKPRKIVRFRDGSTFRYHPVAMIDGPASSLRRQTGEFVRACAKIRHYYTQGEKAADEFELIEEAENILSPEVEGEYSTGARADTKAVRRHAAIWKALVNALQGLGVRCSNERVGRFGPDLKTLGGPVLILFEIKSVLTASAIHEGFGQLHIYDQLLVKKHNGKKHKKVLVLPRQPEGPIAAVLETYDITVLPFGQNGNRVTFNRSSLQGIIANPVSGGMLRSRPARVVAQGSVVHGP